MALTGWLNDDKKFFVGPNNENIPTAVERPFSSRQPHRRLKNQMAVSFMIFRPLLLIANARSFYITLMKTRQIIRIELILVDLFDLVEFVHTFHRYVGHLFEENWRQ